MPDDERAHSERAVDRREPADPSTRVERAVGSLRAPDAAERATAAETLFDAASADASALGTGHLRALAGAISDDDPDVRVHTARALTRVAQTTPRRVEPHLAALTARFDDSDASVRHRTAQAVMAAARGGVAVPPDALRSALGDERDAVRQNAARTLAALADYHPGRLAGERPTALTLLVDPDARVREFAGRMVAAMVDAGRSGWSDPPEGPTDARRRWRASVTLAAARGPLATLAAETAPDPGAARRDVERFCRGVERVLLRETGLSADDEPERAT